MSDPTSRFPQQPGRPEQPRGSDEPTRVDQPAYVPPPGYEEYAPRQQVPSTGDPYGAQQGPPPGYQQGHQQGHQQGYAGAPVRPTSVVAVVGLVLAFLLSPIGAVVSAFGVGDTRGGRKAGRGLAVAGVVVGVLGTLVWVGVAVAGVVLYQRTSEAVTSFASGIESLPAPSDLPSGLPSELPSDLPTDLAGSVDGSADVVVDSCQTAFGGVSTGEVTITNSTGSTASYVVDLYAYDAQGEKVGELGAVQDGVEPGGVASAQALGWADDGAEIASCEVFQALRTAG